MQDQVTTTGSRQTVTVRGRGTASAEPDLVVLAFGIIGRDFTYSAAVEKLNERVEDLRSDLEAVDVERTRLKTTKFDIRPEMRFDKEKDEHVFSHHKASHRMRLELAFDKELLNRVLECVAQSASEAIVRVSFNVSDREALRRRAMRASVADAQNAAEVLAESANVTLGDIEQLDYSFIEIHTRSFSYEFGDEDVDMLPAFAAPNVEPEVLNLEEGVTIVWSIP